jgi:glc operon protein GlcG
MMTPGGFEDGLGGLIMRVRALLAPALAASLLLLAVAHAQQGTTPSPTPPPEYGVPITNEQAKEAAAAALAEARKNNWHMAIAVVGPDGNLVYFEKLDGTQNASASLALAKARTSALFRRPSKVFADQFMAGNTGFMSFPDDARPIASEGGIPIVQGGRLIGAIGVSGGTGQQDGVAATAGANALK